MKKIWLLSTLLIAGLLLTGCRCNVNVNNTCSSEGVENEAKKICLENKWTYSRVTTPEEEYWECMFPSWIGCRDEMILAWECNWVAEVNDIDTEEERYAQCEENVTSWFQDMIEDTVLNNVEYGEEQEVRDEDWELSVINRKFKAYYTREWQNWILDWECEADFVRWGMATLYEQEYLAE